MNKQLTPILVASIAFCSFLTGCGDDDPQALTATDFREQANQICTVGGDEVHEAFFGVFGDDEPAPEEMQAALTTVIAVSHRQLDDIEALAEPADMSDEVTAFIKRGHADTDTAEAMGLDFFGSDDDPWTETGEMARALGLDACAGT
jgi:hypothetical protein